MTCDADRPARVLIMAQPGANSRDIMLDVERGFRDAGHDVLRWELEPVTRLVSRGGAQGRSVLTADAGHMLATFCEANGVDLTLAMWANGLVTAGVWADAGAARPRSLFDRAGIPHVCFWLDAPHWAGQDSAAQLMGSPIAAERVLTHVVNNPGIASEMRTMLGFGRVLARPYGVNPEVFSPRPDIAPTHDIAVNVGPGDPPPTETMRRALESDEPDTGAIRAELAEAARKQMQEIARPVLGDGPAAVALIDAWVQTQLDEPGAAALDRLARAGVDGTGAMLVALRRQPRVFVALGARARSIESWRRAFAVCWLSRRFDVAVFGERALEGWDHRATRLGPRPYRDLSAAYALGRVGLNVMRWQDDVGLNIKPLEITASGRACLCERRSGLDGLFEVGAEVAAFHGVTHARDEAERLLSDDDAREAMARAGRARTLRDHTWAAWADDVVRAALDPAFGGTETGSNAVPGSGAECGSESKAGAVAGAA